MARYRRKKPRPPLDSATLDELALAYVGRFATTRARLASYLDRKIRERGWAGERPADIEAVTERLSKLGYVDDAAYALSKSRALTARGYGRRRVGQSLRAAGVGEDDSVEATDHAEAQAVESALRFARRRRIGPFSDTIADRPGRQRAIAAMVRAGHSLSLAIAIARLEPGSEPDIVMLLEKA